MTGHRQEKETERDASSRAETLPRESFQIQPIARLPPSQPLGA